MNEELKVKSEKYKFSGITLISLVITIVVLIILASVVIYLSLGNNGIFKRASEAREVTNKQTATEKINLKITTAQMNKYAEKQEMPTLKELSEVLRDDDEIKYVTEESQNKIASAEYYNVTSDNPSKIYTKLKEYPAYEFEINGHLQLASINGIKVATNNNEIMPKPKLLWQNPDPDNARGFAAQMVTLAENNCDLFEIYYYEHCSTKIMMAQKCILNNHNVGTWLSMVCPSSSGSYGSVSAIRAMTFNSNISVSFSDGSRGYTGKGSFKDNQYNIPIYILGYETGLFIQNKK